jgi:hypothetical protein
LKVLPAGVIREDGVHLIEASEGDLQTTLVFQEFLITVIEKIGMWAFVLALPVHRLFQGHNLSIQSETIMCKKVGFVKISS